MQKQLPAGWKWVKLGEVANFTGGNTLPKSGYCSEVDNVSLLKVSGLTRIYCDGKYLINGASYTSRILAGKKVVEPPAIVFPKRGGAIAKNRKVITSIPAMLDPNLMAVHTHGKAGAHLEYLYWWFNSFDLSSIQTGTSVPQINRKDLTPLPIPLPPLDEQKRIADILNKAEEIKKLREEADKKTEELIPAIFNEMVGSKTNNGQELPAGWKRVKLGDVCEITSSKRVYESQWQSEGIPFYRARELVEIKKNGYVDNDLFISQDMYEDYAQKYGVPKNGDVLVTGVGTIGITYVVKDDEKFYFKDGNIIWLKLSEVIEPTYLENILASHPLQTQIQSTVGTTVKTLTIVRAKSLTIPLPPLEEQKRIADRLNQAEEIKKTNAESDKKIEELKSSLLQRAFRGEL